MAVQRLKIDKTLRSVNLCYRPERRGCGLSFVSAETTTQEQSLSGAVFLQDGLFPVSQNPLPHTIRSNTHSVIVRTGDPTSRPIPIAKTRNGMPRDMAEARSVLLAKQMSRATA